MLALSEWGCLEIVCLFYFLLLTKYIKGEIMGNMIKRMITISEPLLKRLEEYRHVTGTNISATIRTALDIYLTKWENRRNVGNPKE